MTRMPTIPHFRVWTPRRFVILVGCLFATGISVAPAEDATSNSRTLLFVDNQHVQYYAGVERKVEPLIRHQQNPVIAGGDKPWERLVAYCSVHLSLIHI